MLNKLVSFNVTSTSKDITATRSDIGSYTSKDLTDIFNFISAGDNINLVCWDLDREVSVLLKRLSKTQLIELQKTAKTSYKDHRIFYINGKLFSITGYDSFRPRNIYHIEQYYPDHEDVTDLQEVLNLGNNIQSALKIMGMQSNKLSSPVAIYEDCVLNHIELPTIKSSNITKEAAQFAWRCSGKLWIECYKIGHYESVYDYDISGAFPTFSKMMIDTTDAKWFKDDKFHPEAHYGFCKGYVTINKDITVSPIVYESEDGDLSTPTGTWLTYLTMQEIQFIKEWNIGKFEIHEAWWCICKNPNKRPLENIANRLLAFKKHENKTVSLLAKRMSVGGLYGKFGEEHKDSFGKHFNPVWFSCISTLCRIEVARFIYTHKLEKSLIHVSVDGVLVTKEVNLEQ